MRNLNLFVCSISLRISDAMGNKTLFAIFLRGGTRMKSGENNSWTSEHPSIFHNVNQTAAKQIHFTSWLAVEPKQAMCLVAEVYPSSQPCFFRHIFLQSARKHNLLLHMRWNLTAVCDGMMTLTLQLSRCMFGAQARYKCVLA